jgi:hypothetical protein
MDFYHDFRYITQALPLHYDTRDKQIREWW